MSTEKKTVAKPTGRRFASVEEMMRVDGFSEEVQSKYNEIADATRVVTQLARLRQKFGITQEKMAEHLGVAQPTVSKLESGRDEDLTLGEVRAYAKATGERIGVLFGKPITHVEAIKMNAGAMRHHLFELAKLARKEAELKKEIQAFFGEAFFNILGFLTECQSEMPKGNAIEICLEVTGQKSETESLPALNFM